MHEDQPRWPADLLDQTLEGYHSDSSPRPAGRRLGRCPDHQSAQPNLANIAANGAPTPSKADT